MSARDDYPNLASWAADWPEVDAALDEIDRLRDQPWVTARAEYIRTVKEASSSRPPDVASGSASPQVKP